MAPRAPRDPLADRVAKYESERAKLKAARGRGRGRPRKGEGDNGKLRAREIDNTAAKQAGFYDREEARRAIQIVKHHPDLAALVDRGRMTIRAAYLELRRESGLPKRRRKASAQTLERYTEARAVLGRELARVSRGAERMSEDRLAALVEGMERCIKSATSAWFNRVPRRKPP